MVQLHAPALLTCASLAGVMMHHFFAGARLLRMPQFHPREAAASLDMSDEIELCTTAEGRRTAQSQMRAVFLRKK